MRLLIVEDDRDGRELLAELFRMHDWVVTAVPTTHAGMIELRAGQFDVVISDENVDGESGSCMLREASAQGLLSSAGVLMYTAESGRLEVPRGVRVLRKPLALTRLLDEANAIAPGTTDGARAPGSGERRRERRAHDGHDRESSTRLTTLLDELEAMLDSPPSSRAR